MLKMTQFSNADAIRAGSRPTMGGDPAPDFSAHDASRKIVITRLEGPEYLP